MMSSRMLMFSVTPIVALVLLFALPVVAQQIASLEHDTVLGGENSLVQVDADTVALAYGGDGDDGFIKTFDLSAVFLDGFESGDTAAWE